MPGLSDYDYNLPDEFIAQEPLEDRLSSRLLHLDRRTGKVADRNFTDLETLLELGDLIILNNTRVTAMRLFGQKTTGGKIELLLLNTISPGRYQCLAKPAKRLGLGAKIEFEGGLVGVVDELLPEGKRAIAFENADNLTQRLETISSVPLPPYIHKVLADPNRYQTVVAKHGGSAAAPTAGLHFTPSFIEMLSAKGVQFAEVTLDVGIDTFRPVQVEDLSHHIMHGERCTVSPETAEKVANCKGRIIAVGTTTVRTLESFAEGPRQLSVGTKTSRLFIQPGFQFQVVDAMLTNFHLPKTTMLVMLSAFCQREFILGAYTHALEANYRFLSFGDSMFIS